MASLSLFYMYYLESTLLNLLGYLPFVSVILGLLHLLLDRMTFQFLFLGTLRRSMPITFYGSLYLQIASLLSLIKTILKVMETRTLQCSVFFSLCNFMLSSGCLALCGVKPIKKYFRLCCVFLLGYMLNYKIISTFKKLFLVLL